MTFARARLIFPCLGLLLALPWQVQGQTPPAPTPPPTSQPATSGPQAGARIVAKTFAAALADKTLAKRVFAGQTLKMEKRGRVTLIRIHGKASTLGFDLSMTFSDLAGSRGSGAFTYHYDKAGVLQGMTLTETRRGKARVSRMKRVGPNRLSVEKLRDGKPGKVRETEIDPDSVPMFAMAFFLPQLHDKLPETFEVAMGKEEGFQRAGRKQRVATVSVGRTPLKVGGQLVYELKLKTSNDPLLVRIAAEGANKHKLVEFIVDPKPNRPAEARFVAITPEEAKKLRAMAPLLAREGKALRVLRSLRWKQQNYKSKNSAFADGLEKFSVSKYDKEELSTPGYLVMIRVSPDGSSWMAVAVPEDPGKSGRYFYAFDKNGASYRSKKEIALSDSCEVPAGLEKVR